MNKKRKEATQKFLSIIKRLDANGTNVERMSKFFNGMTDQQFDKYMRDLRDGKTQNYLVVPNMSKRAGIDTLLKVAKDIDCKLYQRIWIKDEEGKEYLTPHKHMVLNLPLRRMQQYLDKKMSVADSDTTIDGLTGQVTGSDRASSITNAEVQALGSKGLQKTLTEFVTVKGGNIAAYGEFKRQLEEEGSSRLSNLEVDSVSRSAVIANVLFESIHIENNFVERE